MRQEILIAAILASIAGSSAASTAAPPNRLLAQEAWPRELRQGSDVVTVYQPQLDSWTGLELAGQAAVSIRHGEAAPTFGVMWFKARTIVDKQQRLVTLEDLTITRTSFPSAPDRAEAYTTKLRAQLANAPRLIALDRLEADLAILLAGRAAETVPVRNAPPRIIFYSAPALLVHIDGNPAYAAVPGTALQRVVNTRPLLLRDATGAHFLRLFDGWLQAPALDGRWSVAKASSRDLDAALRLASASGQADLLPGAIPSTPASTRPSLARGPVPVVYVATSPAELIVTEGEPNWAPIGGQTALLYVKNTTGHVFKHLGDQATYVLVSGRWFRGPSPNGPWQFVAADALPADFVRIPDESPKENVKASVAGTPQAEEALIANRIPQTAKVDRSRTQMTAPAYDGAAQVRPIEGTSLQYVANSATPIIVVGARSYFAVENGVWFTASSLSGPWIVAASVPAVIYSIPPSSPVHYVTYVRVYSATPEVVYVGYTPGYSGTCVSAGVVVYGTGYVYTPWVGAVWYSAPVTYGYAINVTYTPWTGWAYGTYGAYAAYGPGGWAATTGNVYSRWGSTSAVSRTSGGYNAYTGNAWAAQGGASYNSRTGVATAGQRGAVANAYTGNYAAGERGVVQGPGGATAAGGHVTAGNAATGQSVTAGRGAVYNPATGNTTTAAGVHGDDGGVARVGGDVYAGKDGNVYRHGSDGWQHYQDGAWSAVGDPERTRSLEQQRSARGTGEGRVQRFREAGGGGSGRARPSGGSRPRRR